MAEKKPLKQEAVYTRAELMVGASRFGVKPEVVAGAIKLTGKESMTITEAESAVKRFLAQKF